MPAISPNKPYRVGRSRTGLGLFATQPIKKGSKIVRYFGPLLDSKKKKDDAIENKYLFELTNRWTIDGSVRKNVAPLHQPRLQAERGIRRQAAQAQGGDPRHQEHRARRGDQLRLRHRLLQGLFEADRLQMRRLREKAQEEARRGEAERLRLKAKEERKALKKAEKLASGGATSKAKAKANSKKPRNSTAPRSHTRPTATRCYSSRSPDEFLRYPGLCRQLPHVAELMRATTYKGRAISS